MQSDEKWTSNISFQILAIPGEYCEAVQKFKLNTHPTVVGLVSQVGVQGTISKVLGNVNIVLHLLL